MGLLLRVLPYVRPYSRLAILSVVATIASVGVGLLLPWPLKIVVDSVLGSRPLPGWLNDRFGALDRVSLLAVAVLAGLTFTLLVNGLAVAISYVNTRLEQGIILDFRSNLFHHAERLSVAYRDHISTGRLIYAINFESIAAGRLVMALQPLAQGVLTMVGMAWITFRIDHVLALLAVLVVPVLYYAIIHISEPTRLLSISY